jgi:hypothetical protein
MRLLGIPIHGKDTRWEWFVFHYFLVASHLCVADRSAIAIFKDVLPLIGIIAMLHHLKRGE